MNAASVPQINPMQRAVPGGSTPEHTQGKRRKERCVHITEDKLQDVHDVVEVQASRRPRY